MFPYKVRYLDSILLGKNSNNFRKGNIDGYHSSKQIEALIVEEFSNGYELASITPLHGNVQETMYSLDTTIGFMVTFKLMKDKLQE